MNVIFNLKFKLFSLINDDKVDKNGNIIFIELLKWYLILI